jgi:methylmalonyl-CoA carboxyltransferase large subunit
MTQQTADRSRLSETLDDFRQQLARLTERVAALEASAASNGAVQRTSEPQPNVQSAIEGEELLLVISAAVAAYLGKRPRIRHIHLVGTTAWSQQGRVSIQASHALAGHMRGQH